MKKTNIKEHKLGKLGKVLKHFVKEAGAIEHEISNTNLQWPLKVV